MYLVQLMQVIKYIIQLFRSFKVVRNIESNKLKFIGKNLIDLLGIAGNNNNLLRLIYYNTNDPYSPQTLDNNNNIVNQPDITLDSLMDINIILGDVDINILQNSKILCFLHPYRGKFSINNSTGKDTYVLDVCYPHIYFVLKGLSELRPYSIGYEFFRKIDWQNTSGVGKVILDSYVENKLDTTYGCVSFFFTISNSNINP